MRNKIQVNESRKFSLKFPCMRKNYARIRAACLVLNVFIWLLGGMKMAIIATICAVGTAIAAVLFSLWMVKNLLTGN